MLKRNNETMNAFTLDRLNPSVINSSLIFHADPEVTKLAKFIPVYFYSQRTSLPSGVEKVSINNVSDFPASSLATVAEGSFDLNFETETLLMKDAGFDIIGSNVTFNRYQGDDNPQRATQEKNITGKVTSVAKSNSVLYVIFLYGKQHPIRVHENYLITV